MPNVNGEVTLLIKSGYLTEDKVLTSKGTKAVDGVETVFRKTKPAVTPELLGEDYVNQIEKYRKKFPVGKKGTLEEVQEKFAKVFYKHPDITWEIIHKATDLYLSEPRETHFVMKAGNFIMVERGGSITYTLMEYIERINEGDTTEETYNIRVA